MKKIKKQVTKAFNKKIYLLGIDIDGKKSMVRRAIMGL